jgi:hypothetical protein
MTSLKRPNFPLVFFIGLRVDVHPIFQSEHKIECMEVCTTNKGMIILEITPKSCGQEKWQGNWYVESRMHLQSPNNRRLTIALHSTTNQIVE